MDSNTTPTPTVAAGKPSRLPAGSTLEIAPGLHVPHPHAEVNLPGMGDPRLGETQAVTEYTKVDFSKNDKGEDVLTRSVAQKPLADEVKPRVPTVNPASKEIGDAPQENGAAIAASPAPLKIAIEQPTLEKTK